MIALAIKQERETVSYASVHNSCVSSLTLNTLRLVWLLPPPPLPITDTALSGTISERGAKA